jgi:hypothetical protein
VRKRNPAVSEIPHGIQVLEAGNLLNFILGHHQAQPPFQHRQHLAAGIGEIFQALCGNPEPGTQHFILASGTFTFPLFGLNVTKLNGFFDQVKTQWKAHFISFIKAVQ